MQPADSYEGEPAFINQFTVQDQAFRLVPQPLRTDAVYREHPRALVVGRWLDPERTVSQDLLKNEGQRTSVRPALDLSRPGERWSVMVRRLLPSCDISSVPRWLEVDEDGFAEGDPVWPSRSETHRRE